MLFSMGRPKMKAKMTIALKAHGQSSSTHAKVSFDLLVRQVDEHIVTCTGVSLWIKMADATNKSTAASHDNRTIALMLTTRC